MAMLWASVACSPNKLNARQITDELTLTLVRYSAVASCSDILVIILRSRGAPDVVVVVSISHEMAKARGLLVTWHLTSKSRCPTNPDGVRQAISGASGKQWRCGRSRLVRCLFITGHAIVFDWIAVCCACELIFAVKFVLGAISFIELKILNLLFIPNQVRCVCRLLGPLVQTQSSHSRLIEL